VRGAKDNLRGLKENVIIGKLIPVGSGFAARMQAVEAARAAEEAAALGLAKLDFESEFFGDDGDDFASEFLEEPDNGAEPEDLEPAA
jgi:DNA-directed RNA polymerase subunit beta'